MKIEIIKDHLSHDIYEILAKKFGVNIEDIQEDSLLSELSKGNFFKVSLALMDIHEKLDLPITYEEEKIQTMFSTVGKVVQYIENQV